MLGHQDRGRGHCSEPRALRRHRLRGRGSGRDPWESCSSSAPSARPRATRSQRRMQRRRPPPGAGRDPGSCRHSGAGRIGARDREAPREAGARSGGSAGRCRLHAGGRLAARVQDHLRAAALRRARGDSSASRTSASRPLDAALPRSALHGGVGESRCRKKTLLIGAILPKTIGAAAPSIPAASRDSRRSNWRSTASTRPAAWSSNYLWVRSLRRPGNGHRRRDARRHKLAAMGAVAHHYPRLRQR